MQSARRCKGQSIGTIWSKTFLDNSRLNAASQHAHNGNRDPIRSHLRLNAGLTSMVLEDARDLLTSTLNFVHSKLGGARNLLERQLVFVDRTDVMDHDSPSIA